MAEIAAENAVTVKNLLSALEGESNANAKYNAFAIKADADGFRGAASLFRAAARAEQIHATNHARVIVQLGGKVAIKIHEIEVGSMLENLKTALAGEQYEIATMYPGFIAEAIALLEAGSKDTWIAKPRDFFVCPVCGYTSETPNEHDRCPVCNTPWDKFLVIR